MRSLTLALGALVLSASAPLAQEPFFDFAQPAQYRDYYGPRGYDGPRRYYDGPDATMAARVTATAVPGAMAHRRATAITVGGLTAAESGGGM